MDLLRRFLRLARGFLGLFIGDLEEQSPEALLETAKQDYSRRVAQYHQSLARIAGVGERLKLQIEDKVAKSKILDQRILANLKAGNSELAGALARELRDLKSDLEVDVHEFRETEEAYQSNLKSIKLVQHDFAAKVKRLERQLDRAQVKEAQAEAVSGLSGVLLPHRRSRGHTEGRRRFAGEKVGNKCRQTAPGPGPCCGRRFKGNGERTPRHRTTSPDRLHGPSGAAIGGYSQSHRIAGAAGVPTRV